jgi:hypothetical protein
MTDELFKLPTRDFFLEIEQDDIQFATDPDVDARFYYRTLLDKIRNHINETAVNFIRETNHLGEDVESAHIKILYQEDYEFLRARIESGFVEGIIKKSTKPEEKK